ncbi:hypothetical protein BD626DRAFT_543528 [Schizophyllum amplum]|uniref:Uncharacterized protein n=1 Tax=Schizophyllum amplum TaxID=97359 RepID=A0A550BRQ1_9AGAR|nr:hypothetical protein BD626DRAFT_543528 [Auriculariopsis ampla]
MLKITEGSKAAASVRTTLSNDKTAPTVIRRAEVAPAGDDQEPNGSEEAEDRSEEENEEESDDGDKAVRKSSRLNTSTQKTSASKGKSAAKPIPTPKPPSVALAGKAVTGVAKKAAAGTSKVIPAPQKPVTATKKTNTAKSAGRKAVVHSTQPGSDGESDSEPEIVHAGHDREDEDGDDPMWGLPSRGRKANHIDLKVPYARARDDSPAVRPRKVFTTGIRDPAPTLVGPPAKPKAKRAPHRASTTPSPAPGAPSAPPTLPDIDFASMAENRTAAEETRLLRLLIVKRILPLADEIRDIATAMRKVTTGGGSSVKVKVGAGTSSIKTARGREKKTSGTRAAKRKREDGDDE